MDNNILIVGKNFLIQHLYNRGKCNIGIGLFKNVVEFSDIDNENLKKYIVAIVRNLEKDGEIHIYSQLEGAASYIVDLTSKTREMMNNLSHKESTPERLLPKKNKFSQFIQRNLCKFLTFIISLTGVVIGILTYFYK